MGRLGSAVCSASGELGTGRREHGGLDPLPRCWQVRPTDSMTSAATTPAHLSDSPKEPQGKEPGLQGGGEAINTDEAQAHVGHWDVQSILLTSMLSSLARGQQAETQNHLYFAGRTVAGPRTGAQTEFCADPPASRI